jgi:PIN domain nuclease of toxin-antitoxin system
MPRYVLDTSALLTVLNNEPGVDTVLSILEAARSGEAQVHLFSNAYPIRVNLC